MIESKMNRRKSQVERLRAMPASIVARYKKMLPDGNIAYAQELDRKAIKQTAKRMGKAMSDERKRLAKEKRDKRIADKGGQP